MALANYTDLKQIIEDWSHRNDIKEKIDDFIDIAEGEIFKDIRIRDMQKRAQATLDADRFLALPERFVEMRNLDLIDGSRRIPLKSISMNSLEVITGSGIPRTYAITDEIVFDRTPAGTYTLEMQYWQTVTDLDDTNTTNAILTRFPNIYLYGSLWALHDYAMNEDLSERYYQKMVRAIDEANQMDASGRIGPTPRMNYKGPNP